MDDAYDEREEELSSITAIFPELIVKDTHTATLDLPVTPSTPLLVRFVPSASSETASNGNGNYAQAARHGLAHIEHDVKLSHLPPLNIHITLPDGYPTDLPPKASLSTTNDWLPNARLGELESEVAKLWEEYGRCQILFSYIDFLQQAAETGFDLDQSAEGCLTLSTNQEPSLVDFDKATKLSTFNAGTFDCGICLEPKKGSACYQLDRCKHVFCKQCLQDFYNNAIKEGDVVTVRCLDPSCGKERAGQAKKKERLLHPRELLAMGIEEPTVRRYVEMKRKKTLESDKNTVYCPRPWCQHPARSPKYPPIPKNLADYPDTDSDSESATSTTKSAATIDPSDRLAICENEKCQLAFCRICYKSWHGPYARCHPRDPSELSAEEKASYDYIAQNTSPCPYCNSPTQKTMGCNHMNCYQCRTHFCYLCGAWLDAANPYSHYNKQGTGCYGKLWELEEGDEGQGGGFAGARRWEQMAIEVAREADEAEARRLQDEEDERAAEVIDRGGAAHVPQEPIVVNMAGLNIAAADAVANAAQQAQQRPARRPRNPFHAPRAQGAAPAVRAHERNARARRGGVAPAVARRRTPPDAEAQRHEEELRRFLELAQRDEEDGWDSDELGDEAGFVIQQR